MKSHHLIYSLLATTVLTSGAVEASGDGSCEVTVNYCGASSDSTGSSYSKIVARSYNGSDSSHTIAYDDATISSGSAKNLDCEGSKCGIAIEPYGEIDSASSVTNFSCNKTVYYAVETNSGGGISFPYSTSSCP